MRAKAVGELGEQESPARGGDRAWRTAVTLRCHLLAGEQELDVLGDHRRLPADGGRGLGGRRIADVAEGEDLGVTDVAQAVPVDKDPAERRAV